MKKTLLSLLAVFALGASASAQNVAIYEGLSSTTDISGTTVNAQVTSNTYEGYFVVKNLGNSPIDIKIRRVQIITPPAGVTDQVCTGPIPDVNAVGNCYDIAPGTVSWLSPNAATLDETNKGNMEVHIDHHGATGLVHNRYYVEDLNGNRLDSVDVRVGNLAAVKEVKNAVSFNAYPNPADEVINISIQGSNDNLVKIVDVLGNIVLEEKLGNAKKLDVSSFRNGVYILSVYSNGSLLQTRRIVVRH